MYMTGKKHKYKNLLEQLNIDETFTKKPPKIKSYNHVKDNIPLVEDYNMMADLLFLPTARFGFKYLFVIVDLASDEFDIEPIKNKEPSTVLAAMKKCFAREHLNKPEYSLKTDGGNEFKNVFHKYLYDDSILHKVSLPHRHKSMANVESLNRTLGKLLNGYMNSKEVQTGKKFVNWTEAVPTIRTELNKIRKKKLPSNINSYEYPTTDNTVPLTKRQGVTIYKIVQPKYKIDDSVHRVLDYPQDALGNKQPTATFREGDFRFEGKPRKIEQIFEYAGNPLYRYQLAGLKNVSYSESELQAAA